MPACPTKEGNPGQSAGVGNGATAISGLGIGRSSPAPAGMGTQCSSTQPRNDIPATSGDLRGNHVCLSELEQDFTATWLRKGTPSRPTPARMGSISHQPFLVEQGDLSIHLSQEMLPEPFLGDRGDPRLTVSGGQDQSPFSLREVITCTHAHLAGKRHPSPS